MPPVISVLSSSRYLFVVRRLFIAGLILSCAGVLRSDGQARPQAAPQGSTASAYYKSQADRTWIARSNEYAQLLLDVSYKHSPEGASWQGLRQYDEQVSQPTKQDDDALVAQTKALQTQLQSAEAREQNKYVKQDLAIMLHNLQLRLKLHDFSEAHEILYQNASERVFSGLQPLLNEQVSQERRQAALVRLRKYAGLEPGYKPLTELLKQRSEEQMAKAGMIYPSKTEVETALSRDANYWEGSAALFKKYEIAGWEEPLAKLTQELQAYDAWVKAAILPKARSDFREPPEEYALALQSSGIEIPAAQLAKLGHETFSASQKEMQGISAQIAKQRGWPDNDYRAVIRRLKQDQLPGNAILPFYQKRLQEIEGIIVRQRLTTLPERPARIRIATPAETAQQPAPHINPPALVNNTGEQGEFVLPLNMPAAAGSAKVENVDDYTFDAASWTLIAHEARPGHELQFDSMVEHGVSRARALFAFNSANVEGWGLYAEYITKPYMPLEGQLISLQFRLLRAARAFLDPELQAGTLKPEDAMRVLTNDCVFSVPFANQEVERYTFRAPGQAGSYLYGYTKLLTLRKDTEKALGARFDQMKFHDFILDQGLLPPELLQRAVKEDFIPQNKAK